MARLWLPQPNDPSQGRYFTQAARARVLPRPVTPRRAQGGAHRAHHQPSADRRRSRDVCGRGLARRYEGSRNGPELVRGRRLLSDAGRPAGSRTAAERTRRRRSIHGPSSSTRRWRERTGRTRMPSGNGFARYPAARRQAGSPALWITVVGVVGDVHSHGLDKPVPPEMYGLMWQISSLSVATVVRPRGATNVEDLLRREIQRTGCRSAALCRAAD